jgi:hypothetical protein
MFYFLCNSTSKDIFVTQHNPFSKCSNSTYRHLFDKTPLVKEQVIDYSENTEICIFGERDLKSLNYFLH